MANPNSSPTFSKVIAVIILLIGIAITAGSILGGPYWQPYTGAGLVVLGVVVYLRAKRESKTPTGP